MRSRRVLVLAALTAALTAPAAPAMAFHHVLLPAVDCAADAAGNHPGGTAVAVGEHNPVFFPPEQGLPPLPPARTPAQDVLTALEVC